MEEIIIFLLILTLGVSFISLMKSSNNSPAGSPTDLTQIPNLLQPSIQNIINDIEKLEKNYLTDLAKDTAVNTAVLQKASETIQSSKEDLSVLSNDMGEVRKFTDKLDRNPNFKGTVGEEVVLSTLQQLPKEYYEYQYDQPDIEGNPDFVITLPNIAEKIVLDAKFVVANENAKPDNKVISRAETIKKYITPAVTFNFVLMWLPENVYLELEKETHEKLRNSNVVALTTGLIRPLIYLIQRYAEQLKLNEQISEYMSFKNEMVLTAGKSNNELKKSFRQLKNAISNVEKAMSYLNEIDDIDKE